ncbi:hypothetical protein ACLOJK_026791 [Asimina triloba]
MACVKEKKESRLSNKWLAGAKIQRIASNKYFKRTDKRGKGCKKKSLLGARNPSSLPPRGNPAAKVQIRRGLARRWTGYSAKAGRGEKVPHRVRKSTLPPFLSLSSLSLSQTTRKKNRKKRGSDFAIHDDCRIDRSIDRRIHPSVHCWIRRARLSHCKASDDNPMFQSSRKTMKWASLLKDIKEKVGLSPAVPSPPASSSAAAADSAPSARTAFVLSPSRKREMQRGPVAVASGERGADDEEEKLLFLNPYLFVRRSTTRHRSVFDSVDNAKQLFKEEKSETSRLLQTVFVERPFISPSLFCNTNEQEHRPSDKHELELDFKRCWEEFRSSSSEKEKEAALTMAVDVFCRLVKQKADIVHLVTRLVEGHIFSFVVGRAFVTDIEKLKMSSKTRSLDVLKILSFFYEVTKDGITPGSNLLYAIEVLVSGAIDKQPLLDSGILCCLIQILHALLTPHESIQSKIGVNSEESILTAEGNDGAIKQTRQLEVEGSIVHIMKALSGHPSAAQSLIEDDSLQLLFQMIRVLLMAVKDFDPESGDPAYTMGIVDRLLECVELSYRSEAGSTRLREDIHNAHGYQFLVQFALQLSTLQKNQVLQSTRYQTSSEENISLDGSYAPPRGSCQDSTGRGETSPPHLSPSLSRLLDVLVNLAQTGPTEPSGSSGGKSSKSNHSKSNVLRRSRTLSADMGFDDIWEKGNTKVRDLEAIQMLQDIFLKADTVELQAEVLNRMFKIFSSHLENYKLCQQLRTVPLFILNMAGFPRSLQEIILKILEYAVTVVNCIPEQELLSLCCLLQQPISSELKHTILSFFVKLLSFDQQYKKVLREVGVLEVLLDDLKQHKFLSGGDQSRAQSLLEIKSNSSSFKQQLHEKGAIISSPKLGEPGSGKFPVFETERTINVAWDCLVSLLKKAETNQLSLRSSNGVTIVLPFLVSSVHRSGVLRMLSCLITEDVTQVETFC